MRKVTLNQQERDLLVGVLQMLISEKPKEEMSSHPQYGEFMHTLEALLEKLQDKSYYRAYNH